MMNIDEYINELEEITSERAFNVGDRVRVTATADSEHTDVGQVGTVIERSSAPWVAFDEPTRYDDSEADIVYTRLIGWKLGHMDCMAYYELELIDG